MCTTTGEGSPAPFGFTLGAALTVRLATFGGGGAGGGGGGGGSSLPQPTNPTIVPTTSKRSGFHIITAHIRRVRAS
jgi:hypothetical protein